MSKAIGIDLGTVFSCVAVSYNGSIEIIANNEGDRVTPSVVAYTKRGVLVGKAAANQRDQNAQNTFYDSKRLIGRNFNEVSLYDIKRWSFNVENENKKPVYVSSNKLNDKTPVQISAAVLLEMKELAEKFLSEKVTEAVITVPAYFNDSQRRATKDAAERAGLKVLRLLNEPTAAAVAYGLSAKLTSVQNILVFDMGGGTFDVSILTINDGVYEVKAVGGDMHLGGEDFNNNLLDFFLNEFKLKNKVDLFDDKMAISRLLRKCEHVKITLSTKLVANVLIKSLHNGLDFVSSISRAVFEDLNKDYFKKSIDIVEKTLIDAKVEKSEIDEVVLVGGSTYIPKVREMLQECFEGKILNTSIRPDEAVAYGAAVFASTIKGEEMEGNDLVLLDVLPHSLGVAHNNGLFHKFIHRNTSIPFYFTSEQFSTSRDFQTKVPITIYEGERMFANQNTLLGKFYLTELTPALAKELKIKIRFEINRDGILVVTASETLSSSSKTMQLRVMQANSELMKVFTSESVLKGSALDSIKSLITFCNKKELAMTYLKAGLIKYNLKEYNDAYVNLTKALFLDGTLVEAMEKRALIHYENKEYDEFLIECDEIFEIKKSEELSNLIKKVEPLMIQDEPWYKVLKVSENSSKETVEKSFRNLAIQFSLNSKKRANLSDLDIKKMDARMAKINRARFQYKSLQ